MDEKIENYYVISTVLNGVSYYLSYSKQIPKGNLCSVLEGTHERMIKATTNYMESSKFHIK